MSAEAPTMVGEAMVAVAAPRLCLNMIVKNESRIIERCLAAVAGHVACWVIGDTGSTDGTPEIIEQFFAARGIPGELHSFPFENFSQARNEALARARASRLEWDYLLLCDADMELEVDDPGFRARLTEPGYAVEQRNSRERYWNTRLLRRDSQSVYKGVTHEWIGNDGERHQLAGVWYRDHANGANRPEKVERDTRLLEAEVARDPDNVRASFYLAQTYKIAGRHEEAARCYRRRVELGGWPEEVWYAEMQEANCRLKLGDEAAFERGSLLAFEHRPQRAEPLYYLAQFHRLAGRNAVAMLYAEAGTAIAFPDKDILFIDDFIYQAGLREEYTLAAAATPRAPARARQWCDQLAFSRDAPPKTRELARRTIRKFVLPAAQVMPGAVAVEVVGGGGDGVRAQGATLAVSGGRLHLLQAFAPARAGFGAPVPRLVASTLDIAGSMGAPQEIAIPDEFPTVAEGRWDVAALCLFAWDEVLWCVGTRRDRAGGWDGAVLARVDIAAGRLADWRVLPRDLVRAPAGDWQPLVMPGVPGFLAGVDPTTGISLISREVWQGTPACAADHLHPASAVVPCGGGWLVLLRESVPAGDSGGPAIRLAWLSAGLELQRLSRAFRFGNHPVAATLGLAPVPGEERFAVSFTTAGGATRLAFLTAEMIARALLPLAEFQLPRRG